MPGLIVWKKQHINRLKKDIDTMFDRVWGEYGITSTHRITRRMPSFEITETGGAIIIIAWIPEVNPDDMEVAVTGDMLTISTKTHRDNINEGDNYFRAERVYDSFTRNIKIPCPIEANKVQAVYENSILKVIMPKCPPEKTRIIKIRKIDR